MRKGFFVTGTDTEVGKTLAAAALIHALRRRGLRAVGMKPVAAGCTLRDGRWHNDDVDMLSAACAIPVPAEELNPYRFREPIAPHIAAARLGVDIDLGRIEACFDALAARSDAVVVEGAGGFLVPLSASTSFADLAVCLGLPVVLVVGLRLGCINHALLTQEAILRRGLTLAGWIANRIDLAMPAAEDNLDTLRRSLQAPMLADMPWMEDPRPETIEVNLRDA
jgi:dethiobiotin synthetase